MRTTDEDGHTSITYTDNQDREVLSVQSDGSTRLETYKVYDSRGLLRWVLSPEASVQLGSSVDNGVLERLAYYYAYDARKRMTLKRLPGCAPIYMVYDSRDRLVLSQDGEERADNPNRWSYLQYDMQGRVVETGELVLSQAQSHEELQRAASKVENYLPSGTRTALQYTDYDSYPSECSPFQATAGYSESYNAYPIGQVTSVKSRRLATDEWETVTTYYDDYARPIQAITAKGQTKTSRVYTEYDFLGNVVKQQETQSDGTSLETVNTYDSRSRLLSSVTTKNKVETSVVKYGYDAVGRLVEKRYGNTVEKLGYNIRGWLISKESAAFKMRLRYEQPEGGATACYNGNISEWEWAHGTKPALMYSFAYDGFGRLASANQQQASGNGWAGLAANYVEKGITYDRNGNIRTLQRTAAGNPVDDLIYGYRGNRLVSLSEQVRTSQVGDVYLPGNTASGMYEYDSNGNLTKDSRKGLAYKYNRLNLLEEVWKDGEMKAQYNYLSDGTKVSVRDGSGKIGYDYVGSVVYKVVDGRREFDRAVVGDVHFTNEGVRYALTDQLGSVRALIDEDGNVVRQNDYYPFGAKVTREDYANSDDNRFQFSGKESQELLDLNAYDFGARMYDASLGRWNMVDPLGEKYVNLSPYNYCVNNPLVYVDPNGQDYWSTNNPSLIQIFMDTLKESTTNISGLGFASFALNSDWMHLSDSDFAANLYFNDKTNTFYLSYGLVINGVPTVIGQSFPNSGQLLTNRYNGKKFLNILYFNSARANATSGKINVISPEFDILFWYRGLVNTAVSKTVVKFGNNPNQEYHAFRHIDKLRLGREEVRLAIEQDIRSHISKIRPNKPFNKVIIVKGKRLQYTAYKLPDGTINIGRIHEIN